MKSKKQNFAEQLRNRTLLFQQGSQLVLIRCLTIAANLGIADLVADEPRSVDDLSNSVGADPLTLYRMLRLLASYGYFAEDEEGRFGLTPTAEYLRSDQENSMRDYLQLIGARWFWDSLANLPHTIETGEPAFEQVYDIEFFKFLSEDPGAYDLFSSGISVFSDTVHRILAKSFDFGRYKRIVDIGGGQGAFLAAILSEYPAVRGVLLDNPSVVANQEYLQKMGVTDRCEAIGGDFSDAVPPGGDIYILKQVIHNWEDRAAIDLLARCREAMNDNGRVLTIEGVIRPGNSPDPNKNMDVTMMALTLGRERTEKEFQYLYEQAGLKITRIIPTTMPSTLSIIVGTSL